MSLVLCSRQMSPLQRRSIRIFAGCLLLMVFIELIWLEFARHNPSIVVISVFAILPAIVIAAMIAAVGRYLALENDEFVRALVVSSILWSFGVIMVADTMLGVVLRNSPGMRIMPMLNIDLFCTVTPLALRIQLWRNR